MIYIFFHDYALTQNRVHFITAMPNVILDKLRQNVVITFAIYSLKNSRLTSQNVFTQLSVYLFKKFYILITVQQLRTFRFYIIYSGDYLQQHWT